MVAFLMSERSKLPSSPETSSISSLLKMSQNCSLIHACGSFSSPLAFFCASLRATWSSAALSTVVCVSKGSVQSGLEKERGLTINFAILTWGDFDADLRFLLLCFSMSWSSVCRIGSCHQTLLGIRRHLLLAQLQVFGFQLLLSFNFCIEFENICSNLGEAAVEKRNSQPQTRRISNKRLIGMSKHLLFGAPFG